MNRVFASEYEIHRAKLSVYAGKRQPEKHHGSGEDRPADQKQEEDDIDLTDYIINNIKMILQGKHYTETC